jgi:NADH:ubiquinone oxidoreductase subunit E
MDGNVETERVSEIVSAHPSGRQSLIPILQDIQDAFGYLSEDSLAELGSVTGISENEIFGVGTFFTQFRSSRRVSTTSGCASARRVTRQRKLDCSVA